MWAGPRTNITLLDSGQKSGNILRLNSTTAIAGGPINGFLVVVVVSRIQRKRGLPTGKLLEATFLWRVRGAVLTRVCSRIT